MTQFFPSDFGIASHAFHFVPSKLPTVAEKEKSDDGRERLH